MAIKRSTAHRIRLKNIVNSPYEKREGFNRPDPGVLSVELD